MPTYTIPVKYLKDIRRLIQLLRATASEVYESPNHQEVSNTVTQVIDRNGLYCDKEASFEKKILNIEDLELNVILNPSTPFSKSRIVSLLNSRADNKLEDLQYAKETAEDRTADEISRITQQIKRFIFKSNEKEKDTSVSAGFTKSSILHLTSKMETLRETFEADKASCQKKINDCESLKEALRDQVDAIKFFYSKSQKRSICQAYMDNLNEINQAKARILQVDLCLKIIDALIDQLEKELPGFSSTSESLGKENDILNKIENQVETDLEAAEKNLDNLESELFTRVVMPGDDAFLQKLDSSLSMDPELLFQKLGKTRPALFEQDWVSIYNDIAEIIQEENQWILKPDVCSVMENLSAPEYNLHLTRLMQLSQPMLKFDRGLLSPERQSHIVPISIVAVPDMKYRDKIETVLGKIRNNYSVTYEPNYVQTDNEFGSGKYSLSIVNYFSAVPAYVLDDIKDYKQRYEATLNPSCHIGREYEFITEDLFPEESTAAMYSS